MVGEEDQSLDVEADNINAKHLLWNCVVKADERCYFYLRYQRSTTSSRIWAESQRMKKKLSEREAGGGSGQAAQAGKGNTRCGIPRDHWRL